MPYLCVFWCSHGVVFHMVFTTCFYHRCEKSCNKPNKIRRKSDWRRDRDSNPGWSCPHNGFRDRPVRPLRHLSAGVWWGAFSRLWRGDQGGFWGKCKKPRCAPVARKGLEYFGQDEGRGLQGQLRCQGSGGRGEMVLDFAGAMREKRASGQGQPCPGSFLFTPLRARCSRWLCHNA